MKNLNIYTALLVVFLLGSQTDLFAQGNRGNNNKNDKHRKEYYKKQDKNRKKYHKETRYDEDRRYSYSKKHKRKGPPSWAPAHGYRANHHVYFRDYNTFYDPYRGGYVYRNNNRWIFSESIPRFLINVNLNNARVQLMADIPLERHPENYYSQYSRRYPRDSRVNINISF